MKIIKVGRYSLLSKLSIRSLTTVHNLPVNTVLHITQIDKIYHKIIGNPLLDWHYWEIDAKRMPGIPLRACTCGHMPYEHLCGYRGKQWYEIACKNCRRRTGALISWWSAHVSWNLGYCPDLLAGYCYEIQTLEWGYEFVDKTSLWRNKDKSNCSWYGNDHRNKEHKRKLSLLDAICK